MNALSYIKPINIKKNEIICYQSSHDVIYMNEKGDVVWALTGEPVVLTAKNTGLNWISLTKLPKEKVLEQVMKGSTAIVFSEKHELPIYYKGGGTDSNGKPKFYFSKDLSQWEPESDIPVTDIVYGVWYLIN